MDIMQGLNLGDLTGTGLLFYIALKLTNFDTIAKVLKNNCPLFKGQALTGKTVKINKKGMCKI
jgi:hypothetical protein